MTDGDRDALNAGQRRRVIRNGIGIGLATGAYGVTFGALAVASGLSILQTCVLSLVMFTGGSQFAFVGIVGGGGGLASASATAVMLGSRNALYGLTLAPLLRLRGWRRVTGAHLTIDESTALALGEDDREHGRLAFWAGGIGVFVFWNLATVIGAVFAELLPDPRALGLDAVAPAAFLALVAPRLRSKQSWLAAAVGVVVAVAVIPLVPAGLPVIVAAGAVLLLAGALTMRDARRAA